MTRRSDLPQLVDLLRTTADLLEQRGDHAWTITREWQPGPGAANLDPGRGIGTISDPTGQQATARQLDPHIQYVNQLHVVWRACADLSCTLDVAGPLRPGRWCWWLAQAGVMEPARGDIDGRPASRWAMDFYRRHGKAPSIEQARRRATGGRNRQVTV